MVLALLAAADGRSFSGAVERAQTPLTLPSGPVIVMTCGREVMVDEADYEQLRTFRWFAKPMGRRSEKVYAVRTVKTSRGSRHIAMHREIAGASVGQVVDHLNGFTLDNRRSNLRLCSQGENARNIARPADPMRGVSKRGERWVARVCVQGRMKHIGVFDSALEAAAAAAAERTKRDASRNSDFEKVGN
ncbi:MAG: HNH endonuclease [Brevundimonas sp.]|uniref:HNH endonuclease n=1 Tax=Brevundimonas sp. TaxID=1871086 RepID=UPI0040336DCF